MPEQWILRLQNETSWLVAALAVVYVFAVMSAIRAILVTRTAQGAMGWVIALMAMPLIAVPLYWVFGRTRFEGYISRRAMVNARARRATKPLEALRKYELQPRAGLQGLHEMARKLTGGGFLSGNQIELLVGGEATYAAILSAIEGAQRYVLVQYYSFNADGIGTRLADALMRRAAAGVRVSFMYDPIGSSLPRRFLARMKAAGIACSVFDTTRGKGNRFRINFRNHRKIVVVDGETTLRHDRRRPGGGRTQSLG